MDSHETDMSSNKQQNCSVLRFVIVILSFISLFSRIIYCTYATWLVLTTFDCIPCPNSSLSNDSTSLFRSPQSSASFMAVRGIDVTSNVKQSKFRFKRSNRVDVNNSSNDSITDDYYVTQRKAEKFAKQIFARFSLQLLQNYSESTSESFANQTNAKMIENFFGNDSSGDNSLSNISNNLNHSLLDIELQNESQVVNKELVNQFFNERDGKPKLDETESKLNESVGSSNVSNNVIHSFIRVERIEDLFKGKNESNITFPFDYEDYSELTNKTAIDSNKTHNKSKNANNDSELFDDYGDDNEEANTMIIILNEPVINGSQIDFKNVYSNRSQKNLNDDQLVNDTSYRSLISNITKKVINHCSEDCSMFLSFEMNDPDLRRAAMIVMTSVLFIYALVMLCIFLGACFLLTDILIIATFIEGAKLFAGFILIVIDSFNGKQVHFNLVDVKFNLNPRGNGWTADFSYSEYLLDILIFLLSIFLCISVFKCSKKRGKKVSSIETLYNRGTYRTRDASNPNRIYPYKA